jgi:hypothetical protein
VATSDRRGGVVRDSGTLAQGMTSSLHQSGPAHLIHNSLLDLVEVRAWQGIGHDRHYDRKRGILGALLAAPIRAPRRCRPDRYQRPGRLMTVPSYKQFRAIFNPPALISWTAWISVSPDRILGV